LALHNSTNGLASAFLQQFHSAGKSKELQLRLHHILRHSLDERQLRRLRHAERGSGIAKQQNEDCEEFDELGASQPDHWMHQHKGNVQYHECLCHSDQPVSVCWSRHFGDIIDVQMEGVKRLAALQKQLRVQQSTLANKSATGTLTVAGTTGYIAPCNPPVTASMCLPQQGCTTVPPGGANAFSDMLSMINQNSPADGCMEGSATLCMAVQPDDIIELRLTGSLKNLCFKPQSSDDLLLDIQLASKICIGGDAMSAVFGLLKKAGYGSGEPCFTAAEGSYKPWIGRIDGRVNKMVAGAGFRVYTRAGFPAHDLTDLAKDWCRNFHSSNSDHSSSERLIKLVTNKIVSGPGVGAKFGAVKGAFQIPGVGAFGAFSLLEVDEHSEPFPPVRKPPRNKSKPTRNNSKSSRLSSEVGIEVGLLEEKVDGQHGQSNSICLEGLETARGKIEVAFGLDVESVPCIGSLKFFEMTVNEGGVVNFHFFDGSEAADAALSCLEDVKKFFKDAGETIVAVAGAAIDAFGDAADDVVSIAKDGPKAVSDAIDAADDAVGAIGGAIGSCFPADSVVQTEFGEMQIADLRVGHRVLVVNAAGALVFDDVYAFGHADAHSWSLMVHLQFEDEQKLQLSGRHFIQVCPVPSMPCDWEQRVLQYAKDIQAGHVVWILISGQIVQRRVAHAVSESLQGMYNPYTLSGNIIVNNVSVSCHSDWFLDDWWPAVMIQHLPVIYQSLLLPVRAFYLMLPPSFADWFDCDNPSLSGPRQSYLCGSWTLVAVVVVHAAVARSKALWRSSGSKRVMFHGQVGTGGAGQS